MTDSLPDALRDLKNNGPKPIGEFLDEVEQEKWDSEADQAMARDVEASRGDAPIPEDEIETGLNRRSGPDVTAEGLPMPLVFKSRAAWLEGRRGSLGSSDWPAVLGVCPFRGPLDVYVSKTQPPEEDDPSLPMRLGNFLEPGIVDWLCDEFEMDLQPKRRGYLFYRRGVLHSTPDDVAMPCEDEDYVPIEVKLRSYRDRDRWADGPPIEVQLQCQAHLYCLDLERCAVGVFFGSSDARAFWVERHPKLDAIVAKLERWWETHVVAEDPPEPTTHLDLDAVRRIYPTPEGEADILLGTDELKVVRAWTATKEARLALDKAEKAQGAYLRWRLEDFGSATFPDGTGIYRDKRNVLRITKTK